MAKKTKAPAPKPQPPPPMPIVTSAKPRVVGQCCNCDSVVGDNTKKQPLFVDDGKQNTHRTWCPACFFSVRAPKEPDRWKNVVAVDCARCSWQSVIFGFDARELPRCPKCNGPGPRVIVTPAILKQALDVAP